MTVYFIGAGPGDPDLITVKGLKLIQQCPVILYAGSLVPEEIIMPDSETDESLNKKLIIDTASLNLDQIIEQIQLAHDKNYSVARVHSGDPAIYGAIGEQMRRLDQLNITYEVIPGVTSMAASAASIKKELTLSGISQTVIMTRYSGKTPMPERENLKSLAQHGATLAIHLGITRIHKIVDDLIPFYGENCPVAVCYRTGWPDEQIIHSTLKHITQQVRDNKITRTALILVGWVINPDDFKDSYLYHKEQAHVYRPRVKPATPRTVKRPQNSL